MVPSEIDWGAVDRELIRDSAVAGRAYAFAAALCEVGEHRFAGSAGDREASGYLQRAMAEAGLAHIRSESFSIKAWERGRTELLMLAPQQRRLDALALAFSPSAALEADLVDVGFATEDEFALAGAAVQGAFVLARSDTPGSMARKMYRGEKALRARMRGAAGIVISNGAMGLLPLAGSLGFSPEAILPAVSVSFETGEALRRRLRIDGKVRLRLEMEHSERPATTCNVVGDLLGQALSERYMLVGAHFDSHDLCPGARDNAGGVGVALEIARLLARSPVGVGRTLRFVAFGAEELALLGSQAYIDAHTEELDSLDLMLDLDCAGRPGPKDLCVHNWPGLRPLLTASTEAITDLGCTDASPSTHMDHFNFFLRGIPTALLAATDRSIPDPKDAYHHTPADTIDKLTAEDLQAEALRAVRALVRLSWAQPWPVSRRSPAEVRQLLDRTGLTQALAFEGRAPPAR